MKKKMTALMLCTAMFAGLTPGIAADEVTHISSVEQLAGISADGASLDGSYILDNNIDLTGYSWTAIGTSSLPFTGEFDGNGYSVTGLSGTQGMFAVVNGGTVKNLKVEGNVSGRDSIALVAGSLLGAGQVLNCYASGSVSGRNYVGGLVGQTNNSSNLITNSCFIGEISGSARGPGGIVSSLPDHANINNCYVAASFDVPETDTAAGTITGSIGGSDIVLRAYADISLSGDLPLPADPEKTGVAYDAYGLTTAQMRSEDFVRTLNSNISEYGTGEWSSWTYNEAGYPIQQIFNKTGEVVTPKPQETVSASPSASPPATPEASPGVSEPPSPSATASPKPSSSPTADPIFTMSPATPAPTATPVSAPNPSDQRSAYDDMNFIDYNEYYNITNNQPETLNMNSGGVFTRTDAEEYYIRFDNVDFGDTGTYAAELYVRMTAFIDHPEQQIEIYTDSLDTPVGTLDYGQAYKQNSATTAQRYGVELTEKITGKHTVYVKWQGSLIGIRLRFAEGIISLSEYENVLPATLAQMRVSENGEIQNDSYGDGGPAVQCIGKYSMLDSISFPAVDFGSEGVSKTVTLRLARSSAMQVEQEFEEETKPKARILLGGRGGEVIAETEIPASSAAELGKWYTYTMELPEKITGIHMITVQINYETKLRYIAFDYDVPEPAPEEYEEIDGHKVMTPEQAVMTGTFTGTRGEFMPKYALMSGDMVFNSVKLDNAEYLTAYVATSGQTGTVGVFMDEDTEPIAEITADSADFYSVTAQLKEPVSGVHTFTFKTTSGRALNIGWMKFMTSGEKDVFDSRTRIAFIGESEFSSSGRRQYTTQIAKMADSEQYRMECFFTAAKLGALDTSEITAYAPGIVVIMFGRQEMQTASGNFEENYQKLIDALKTADPNVKIYIQTPVPLNTDAANYGAVRETLYSLAEQNGAEVIDIYDYLLGSGYPREYLFANSDRGLISSACREMIGYHTYRAIFGGDTVRDGVYEFARDAELIGIGSGGSCTIGAFKTGAGQYIKTSTSENVSDKAKTFIMLKDVDLEGVRSMTVSAARKTYTASALPVIECRLDSPDGQTIGRIDVVNTAQNTEYAFQPITNSIIPVTDGKTHNLFFVLDKGSDITDYDVINLKSVSLNRDEAPPVVLDENGVIIDRSQTVILSEASKAAHKYEGGSTYTWITAASDSGSEAQFITAVFDHDGRFVTSAVSEKGTGALSVTMTLPENFEADGCYISGYVWELAENGRYKLKPLRMDTTVTSNEKLKIGLIGDSTTNNVTVNSIAFEDRCYPNCLRGMMDREKYEILNFGRGTTTTGQYLTSHRIWFEYAKSEQCGAYFIMLGTNNAKGVELNTFKENYKTIISGLREASPGCSIFIMTPIPAQKDAYMIEEATLTDVIIPMVKEVAEEEGLPLIDMYSVLKNSERFEDMYGSDGIHENEEGMILIAETVRDVIINELQK